MTLLDYSEEPNKKLPPLRKSDKRSLNKNDDLIDLFPLPRYFQVHFAHLHDATNTLQGQLHHRDLDLQNQLDQLKQTLANVEDKLDRFITLLGQRPEL